MIKEIYEKIRLWIKEKIDSRKYVYDIIENKNKKCVIMRSRGVKKAFYNFSHGEWRMDYDSEGGKTKEECICAVEYFMTGKIKNRYKRDDVVWSSDD